MVTAAACEIYSCAGAPIVEIQQRTPGAWALSHTRLQMMEVVFVCVHTVAHNLLCNALL